MSVTAQYPYCVSRFQSVRRQSREVRVGDLSVGGNHPIVIQSMTTTPTQDVVATVKQAIAMAEAGCQIVRVTAQNVKAAEALGPIRREFSAAGFAGIPLVADIHFLPQAAMEAAKHVEKVRINPGNYADKKKFQVKEYSESEYEAELERLHEAFSPIVLRCKELGRAMRIGTNHGSLSDRIMNRYGDSPLGMCESALEFLRIAEYHGFHDIILSMKASNPKVAIQAYRLIVARMLEENMHYPLHLGVTEAGDGDDARIKSAIGIGSLLYDGLGDTIRVSLTEDRWRRSRWRGPWPTRRRLCGPLLPRTRGRTPSIHLNTCAGTFQSNHLEQILKSAPWNRRWSSSPALQRRRCPLLKPTGRHWPEPRRPSRTRAWKACCFGLPIRFWQIRRPGGQPSGTASPRWYGTRRDM